MIKVFLLTISMLVSTLFFFFKKPTENTEIMMPPPMACETLVGTAKIVCLAENLKATLSETLLAQLQLPYSVTDAKKWSNFPQAFSRPSRVGLPFAMLNEQQLAAAKALMINVLGQGTPNEGYDELEGTLLADDYFGKAVGKTNTFGSGNYLIAFLGKPSATELWELQFGGHHFAFGNTYKGGKIVGVTPSFRGVEPEQSIEINSRTYQPLAQEHAAFSKILEILSESEKNTAKLSTNFRDILLGPNKDGQFPTTKQGLRIGDLTTAKQEAVIIAIQLYVNDLDAATAKTIMAKYTAELADTYLLVTSEK